MKERYLVSAISAVTLLAGCGQSGQESTAGGETPKPVVVSVECPPANDDGIIEMQEGLSAKVMSNGYGRVAEDGDLVGVHADLWVYDDTQPENKGAKVWSSGGVDPFEFQLGADGFIKGWSPGITCMHLGEKRELVIAPALAYGERGNPPVPPNATLLYELELVTLQSP